MGRAALSLTVPLVLGGLFVCPRPADAQSWPVGRQGPAIGELFVVDRTGEAGWLYGSEDVAGDGVGNFGQPEQSIDVRTAYAAADDNRLYVRIYVSSAAAPGGTVSGYIFIDSDQNRSTGGNAAAANIDARFTGDASGGGYEYVLGVRGDQSVIGLWAWQPPAWAPVQIMGNRATAEAGAFLDPIRINGDVHGYLQGSVELALVAVTSACQANLFVRTTNEAGPLGAGDLDVGQVARCVPADANNNRVPDPVEPTAGCTSNAQCPNGGVCIDGRCVLAPGCATDADCLQGERCDNGRCVAQPTNTPCSDNSDCGDLVCTAGRCGPCTAGGDQCGTGFVCGPGGRCVDEPGGPALLPGEEVQGGACTCTLPRRSDNWGLVASALLIAARAFRRRPVRPQGGGRKHDRRARVLPALRSSLN